MLYSKSNEQLGWVLRRECCDLMFVCLLACFKTSLLLYRGLRGRSGSGESCQEALAGVQQRGTTGSNQDGCSGNGAIVMESKGEEARGMLNVQMFSNARSNRIKNLV